MVICAEPKIEHESHEYGALRFTLDGKDAVFRQAKTTPKKIGQFVTLWKRDTPTSEISPFDSEDEIELFVVATCNASQHGVFLFDREILTRKGVVSINGKGGKRAMRVYAPWDEPHSKQAIRTQVWQLDCFHSLD
ncbi:hypothetical protein GCM10007392_20530 [Saccharospirillum salsuginis]|uniref:MepB protein n=2 Tax=Saccharospirillum salsuginis TaxID=418750 RepID=A0A918NA66_9GAMM|nr:hypothetical protein GCM10007392_20530 [Saccharospirillum salsuginis]